MLSRPAPCCECQAAHLKPPQAAAWLTASLCADGRGHLHPGGRQHELGDSQHRRRGHAVAGGRAPAGCGELQVPPPWALGDHAGAHAPAQPRPVQLPCKRRAPGACFTIPFSGSWRCLWAQGEACPEASCPQLMPGGCLHLAVQAGDSGGDVSAAMRSVPGQSSCTALLEGPRPCQWLRLPYAVRHLAAWPAVHRVWCCRIPPMHRVAMHTASAVHAQAQPFSDLPVHPDGLQQAQSG